MQIKVKDRVCSMVFLLGLLVLLISASVFFRPKDNTEECGMEEVRPNGILAEPEGTIDVLVVGDSISYCAIMPLQIWRNHGITSYVCGTPWQELYESEEFLKKAFEKQSPKMVILETSTMFHKYEKKEEVRNKIERILPVFRYHDRWKEFDKMLEVDMTLDVNYTFLHPHKGYRYYTNDTYYDPGNYAYQTQEVEPIPRRNKKKILEIAEFCEKQDAELVFMSMPNSVGWSPKRHNAISLLAEEIGAEYVDINYLTEEVPIVWKEDCFDEGEHMNLFGAKKVTTYVGKYLAQRDIFEDKRKNEQYVDWNKEQEAFFLYFDKQNNEE